MADKKIEIKINPFMLNGKKTWELEVVGGGKGGPDHYPPAKLQEKFGGNFEITIVDGNGITFSKDPIWIQAGTTKPTGHVIDPQITKIKGQDTTVLTFHDNNTGAPMTLTYQLNFNNAQPLDPIIENGGGTVPPRGYSEYLIYGGGAIFLTVLLVLAYRRFFAH